MKNRSRRGFLDGRISSELDEKPKIAGFFSVLQVVDCSLDKGIGMEFLKGRKGEDVGICGCVEDANGCGQW